MQTNPISSETNSTKSIPYLLILLLTSLGIGSYLIYSTELISKDGITFIRYAQHLFSNPRETLLTEYQHPGFPFIIVLFHQALAFIIDSSFYRWILAAQISAVFFKTLTIVVLYCWGQSVTNLRVSFWGLIIFLCLPHPAQYGSDALSDWPNLFFLAAGLLCLQVALDQKKYRLFCLAGICGGLGYLIRPESFQLVLYALLASGMLLFTRKISVLRFTGISLAVVLSFAIISFPYMMQKKAIFPKKTLIKVTDNTSVHSSPITPDTIRRDKAGISANPLLLSLPQLLSNFGETHMWYFCPFWVIGLIGWFRTAISQSMKMLLSMFIFLNLTLMALLYASYGYMSIRHTLPLFVLTFPFTSYGAQAVSEKINVKHNARNNSRIFYLIICIGIAICLPKLFRPLGADKRIYKDAAMWLQKEVKDEEMIAVFDPRIGFYSQKSWVEIKRKGWQQADWIVTCTKNGEAQKEVKLSAEMNQTPIHTVQDPKKSIYISQLSRHEPDNSK